MIKRKVVWNHTPFSRDLKEHEEFAKTVIVILNDVTGKKYKVKVECVGFKMREIGPMGIVPTDGKYEKFIIKCSYIDCIVYDTLEVFRNRFGKFLEANGYAFNPLTYAIMSILHEIGHIEFYRTMLDGDVFDTYRHISNSNNDLMTITLKEHEKELGDAGIHVRYLLSGDEMFCDGFAMTYFRAVANALVSKGFSEELLHKKFRLKECLEV